MCVCVCVPVTDLQEKKSTKRLKNTGNVFRKNLQLKSEKCLLILNLKPFRSYVKGKHSISREF